MNFQKLESYELSNTDITKILGKIPIIRYPDLANYNSLHELLNNKFNAFVLFYETQSFNVGHWCCMFRNSFGIEYFDSYGLSPLNDLNHISQKIKVQLREVPSLLPDLIMNAINNGETVICNSNDYQSWKGDVSTCGKHCSVRLLNKNLSDKQYYNYLLNYMKNNNLNNFDECVSEIIYNIIGK